MKYEDFTNDRKNLSRITRTIPNIITALALCAGLLSIRFSIEGHFDYALAAIVASAVLDGLDGRLARMLGATSRFGAEFDSLADFLSFGLAPIILLFFWAAEAISSSVSLCLMAFALASALRLAQFNAQVVSQEEKWRKAYFIGMPTPSAAMAVLLPVSIVAPGEGSMQWVGMHTLLIAFLMISTIPTFSGKKWVIRSSVYMVVGLICAAGLLLMAVAIHPREFLVVFTVLYLSSIPVSWISFRYNRKLHDEILLPEHG